MLLFFNEHAKDFHHGGERMILIFAHFVNETVELFHKLAVFALIVRDAQSRFDLRPDGKRSV